MYTVEENMNLVKFTVNKYFHGGKHFKAYALGEDDLIQIGYIGLIKACNAFDENRGVKFSTYAVRCIKSEIYNDLRDRNSLIKFSRSAKEISGYLIKMGVKVKDISKEYIMEKFDVSSKVAINAIECLRNRSMYYLEENVKNNKKNIEPQSLIEIVKSIEDTECEAIDKLNINYCLEKSKLSIREKECFLLNKLEYYSQSEIAEMLSISQATVGRAINRAIVKIKKSKLFQEA